MRELHGFDDAVVWRPRHERHHLREMSGRDDVLRHVGVMRFERSTPLEEHEPIGVVLSPEQLERFAALRPPAQVSAFEQQRRKALGIPVRSMQVDNDVDTHAPLQWSTIRDRLIVLRPGCTTPGSKALRSAIAMATTRAHTADMGGLRL